MAIPGRKPKPTKLKELQGNPGRRPLPKNEPHLERKLFRVPAGTKKAHPHIAQFYKLMARTLYDAGISNDLNRVAFEAMAKIYERLLQAGETLDRDGLFTVDERGLIRKHPALTVERYCADQLKSYLVEFGATPSAATRIVAMIPEEEPSLADMFWGGD